MSLLGVPVPKRSFAHSCQTGECCPVGSPTPNLTDITFLCKVCYLNASRALLVANFCSSKASQCKPFNEHAKIALTSPRSLWTSCTSPQCLVHLVRLYSMRRQCIGEGGYFVKRDKAMIG